MTNLFNGALKDKFKHALPSQDRVIRALARNNTTDNKTYNCEFDTSKLPLPIELLKHELDVDTQLQDTLLGICDKDGMPFKMKYLCETLDDVRELIQTEEFFNKMPMTDEISYFISRDWIGRPVSKWEIDAITRQRKIFEKRAFKKRQQYYKRQEQLKKEQGHKLQVIEKDTILTF